MAPPANIAAVITALRDTTPNTRVFSLRAEVDDYCFTPGQHCLVSLDGVRARPFSFTTTPRQCPAFELVIKRVGVVTGQLFSLGVGDRLWVSRPMPSRFLIAPVDRGPVVLLAGGTGLTPFLSLIRDCTERQAENRLTLLFANRGAEDIICRAELEALARQNAHFTVVFTVDVASAAWRSEVGRIDLAMVRRYVPDFTLPRFMICGRPPMVVALRSQLLDAGVAATRITI